MEPDVCDGRAVPVSFDHVIGYRAYMHVCKSIYSFLQLHSNRVHPLSPLRDRNTHRNQARTNTILGYGEAPCYMRIY
jgi:hypothetical protein